ncbi:hypothetical protein AMJ52_03985 [candidate division TA06 bacterium DG_78]|uniref:CHASE2 domain-containing protein n=1 Tax=candidate division TA06 bacterium DG_78 TaxID=1703772 RepID=A0A0S7YEW2_UNCT6|nr:MAG: hypothetical protein AMJ52_03985 [candidate division TA06 bacterium DG_78]
MNIFQLLTKIPRQIIFLVVAIAIAIPMIVPIGMPVNVMPKSEKLFKAIDELGPQSKPVLVSVDFDPQSMPELYPMLLAIMRHCFARDVKVILMNLWPQGPGLAEMAVSIVPAEFNKEYSKDYAFLGYKFGVSAVLLGMGESIRGVFPTDYYGTPLDSIEMLSHINNYEDLSLVVTLSTGDPGWRQWLLYAQSRYGAKLGVGVTAVSAADVYPYVETGQVIGLLAGMKGASEYEVMVQRSGYSDERRIAVQGMDAQSLGHLLIMILIVLGNIGYFFSRRRSRRQK